MYGYALQIYFDFSGYTDIAMGVSQLLGIVVAGQLQPAILVGIDRGLLAALAHHVFELASGLPLLLAAAVTPGMRKCWRTTSIPLIVMLLGGLWHGIGWTFIAWGLLHGVGLTRCTGRGPRYAGVARENAKATAWGRSLSIFRDPAVCMPGTWIFFRAPDIATTWAVLGRIGSGTWGTENISGTMLAWFAAAILLQFIPVKWFGRAVELFGRTPWVVQGAAMAGVVLVIERMAGQGGSSFVYSNF